MKKVFGKNSNFRVKWLCTVDVDIAQEIVIILKLYASGGVTTKYLHAAFKRL